MADEEKALSQLYAEFSYEKVCQVVYTVMLEADFVYVFSLYLMDMQHYQTLEQHAPHS